MADVALLKFNKFTTNMYCDAALLALISLNKICHAKHFCVKIKRGKLYWKFKMRWKIQLCKNFVYKIIYDIALPSK